MFPPPTDQRETILVVDDNLQNREVAEGHLVGAGYAAIQADGGARALALFEEKKPDLVLLDVLMPLMDGFETCRRLRQLPGGAATPILFLTALGDLGTHRSALDSGADDFLTKPINRTELLIRIRSLLRIRRLSDELRGNYDVIRAQRDALLEAHRQKEELTALIIHDLKNPLTSILSNAQFVSRSAGMTALERESQMDVLRSSQAMLRMVMNLLDVSRSDDGALVAHMADFDMPALLEEIASEMRYRLADKNQRLAVSISDQVGRLQADRDLVRRIIENLIDNAHKYGPGGSGIGISVGAGLDARRPDAPEVVEVRVSDEGRGIPDEYRHRIFEKYVRIEDGQGGERSSSHGLGLLFCRRAVEVHQGSIWVEDNHPRGACFCVRLPALRRS
ncbi:MAG TPA: hybrid sensor histidine kinase/response regulator [Polyangia bacterium]|nr:hybrid sensor histidine kinase/response regulator [Polyangia bacterium]